MSPEQQAIRQHLSKPARGCFACGCMGPQPINGHSGKCYPVCPCAMSIVEEVNGVLYQVVEDRTPDGITHSAQNLGPIGGPYNCDRYGEMLPCDEVRPAEEVDEHGVLVNMPIVEPADLQTRLKHYKESKMK